MSFWDTVHGWSPLFLILTISPRNPFLTVMNAPVICCGGVGCGRIVQWDCRSDVGVKTMMAELGVLLLMVKSVSTKA